MGPWPRFVEQWPFRRRWQHRVCRGVARPASGSPGCNVRRAIGGSRGAELADSFSGRPRPNLESPSSTTVLPAVVRTLCLRCTRRLRGCAARWRACLGRFVSLTVSLTGPRRPRASAATSKGSGVRGAAKAPDGGGRFAIVRRMIGSRSARLAVPWTYFIIAPAGERSKRCVRGRLRRSWFARCSCLQWGLAG